jgi:hypothetical protein
MRLQVTFIVLILLFYFVLSYLEFYFRRGCSSTDFTSSKKEKSKQPKIENEDQHLQPEAYGEQSVQTQIKQPSLNEENEEDEDNQKKDE